jgi:hypothetical protein
MKLYIDGTDLLDYFAEQADGTVLAAGDPEETRANLRRWIARYCEARGCDGVLFFDDCGPTEIRPLSERVGRVKVVNLPYRKDAWTEIAGQANRAAMEDQTLVVTADPRLTRALEHGKAKVATPQHFVTRARRGMGRSDEELAEEPDEKYSGLSEEEVDLWLDFFKRSE